MEDCRGPTLLALPDGKTCSSAAALNPSGQTYRVENAGIVRTDVAFKRGTSSTGEDTRIVARLDSMHSV